MVFIDWNMFENPKMNVENVLESQKNILKYFNSKFMLPD